MTLETAIFVAANVAEAAVVGLLLYRRAWRTLPFFLIYSIESLLGSILYYGVQHYCSRTVIFKTYFDEAILDSILQFCVMVEIAWSIFRPYRKSLPRYTILVLGILIAIAGAAIWQFSDSAVFAHESAQWHILIQLQQTVSILRVLLFLVLAGCSQLLSIGWKDRELQVATGLGFYSLVSLSVTMWHSHQTTEQQYAAIDQLMVASYFCSLLYWVFSFAQQEVQRREFSPQMQGLLLAVAGSARSSRVTLDSQSVNPRKRGNP